MSRPTRRRRLHTLVNQDAILRTEPRPNEDPYRGYLVKYRPQPTPEGRYLAFAIISCGRETLQTVASVMPDLPSFAIEAEAANAGWVAGMGWVDGGRRLWPRDVEPVTRVRRVIAK